MEKDYKLIIKQLEHIVNYECEHYESVEEIIKDIERILKNEKVFENWEMGEE